MSDNKSEIPDKKESTKEEKRYEQKTGRIILFIITMFLIVYSFYMAIYIAGDHEHVITVTCKEEIYNEGKNFLYIHGINEKGKESVYEVGSRWIENRKGYTDENIWIQIKEGQTYRVRATGLCWGLEAEPLLCPISVVLNEDTTFVNNIKNPAIIVGITVFIIFFVGGLALFSLLSSENFIQLIWDPNKPIYRMGLRNCFVARRGGWSAMGLAFVFGAIVFINMSRSIIIKIADLYYLH